MYSGGANVKCGCVFICSQNYVQSRGSVNQKALSELFRYTVVLHHHHYHCCQHHNPHLITIVIVIVINFCVFRVPLYLWGRGTRFPPLSIPFLVFCSFFTFPFSQWL